MAMLSSSCTLLMSQPPAALAPGKFSPAATLQLRRQAQSAASSSSSPLVALRWVSSCKESRSRRASLLSCRAKYQYDIEPDVLVRTAKLTGNHWNVMVDEDLFIIKLRVDSTSKDNLKVRTTPDQASLVIKYEATATAGSTTKEEDSPASDLNVELTLPQSFKGNKVDTKTFDGWLLVIIAKPKKVSVDIN